MNEFHAFKNEIKEACKKHNLYISHEDTHGAFIIRRSYSEDNMKWFMNALTEGQIRHSNFF